MCDIHRASGSPAFAAPSAFWGARLGCVKANTHSLAHINGATATRRPRVSGARMMAGVPKVPYKAPGAQNHEFIDIFNRLYRERIIYIGQDLDDEQANQIIAVLLYLDQTDAKAGVQIYFNSPGGTMSAGLAVYDCIRHMQYDVTTINLGLAASMGAFLMGAGTKGKRMALPNARFLLQAPAMHDVVRGQASDVVIEVNNILSQRTRMIKGLSEFTGRTEEEIRKELKRDFYLTAPEAREWGLIDRVLLPKTPTASKGFIDSLSERPSFV